MNSVRFCHRGFIILGLAIILIGSKSPALIAQPRNFKIAFIGDQGDGADAEAVLNLIKNEGAAAVVHSGDFDYNDDPQAWDNQINKVLGPDFPYFASIGNHDEARYYGVAGYQSFLVARMNRLGISWDGDLGVQSSFSYNGIFFLLTGPDVIGTGHDIYIRDKLAADNSIWSISSWHKNMRFMQVGGKSDETGWGVYEESRKGGAIIATGHEHSYSRTHLLSSCQNQTVASTSNTLVLTKDDPATPQDEGKTFVFVSGLGGNGVRDQQQSGGAWWASIYTSTQNANHGALFGTFNGNRADFYFKSVDGVVPDNFVVISNVASSQPPMISSFSPTSGPYGADVFINGDNFAGATQVAFNNIATANFTVVSNTQIRATVPAGASTGRISVATPGGTATSTDNFSVTPPLPPSIASFIPTSGPAGTQVTITGANFTGATQVAFNNIATTNFTVVSNTQIRAAVPAGASTGRIRLNTVGGTATSPNDFTVTLPPPPTIASFNPASGPFGTPVTITGNNLTNATQVTFNNIAATNFLVDSNTQIRVTVPAGASTGRVRVTTPGGTATSTNDFTVTIPLPPSITSFTPISGPAGTQVTITGNDLTAVVQVTFNNIIATNFSTDSNTQIRATVPAGASTGRIRLTTTGGMATSPNDFTVTLPPPPTIASFTPTSGPAGIQVTITGDNLAAVTQVTFNNVAATNFSVDSNTQIRATVPAGVSTGRIRLITPGGTATSTSDFSVIVPPSISSFTPTSGLVGTQVTISGNNLAAVTQVNFNGVAATFTVNSNTQIHANVPAGALTGKIDLTAPGGTATSTIDFTVTVPLPPSIVFFAPESGPVGTQVTLTGANFIGATQVIFNNVAATNFTVVSNTQIRATVPARASTGRISIATPGGTATSLTDFTLTFQPSISSFIPTRGPVGTQVTIIGNNFAEVGVINFNGVIATTFRVDSNTQIRADVPDGATSGRIDISGPNGTGVSRNDFLVAPLVSPTIVSFTPASGPVGTQVTITGSYLADVTQVTFNGVAVSTFTLISETQIRANVPPGATTGMIEVSGPSGTGTSTNAFIVVALVPPTITSFSPASGPVGTQVIITGDNLTGVTQVTFNSVAVTNFAVVSSTQIRANVPAGATTGKVNVTAQGGTAISTSDFTVIFPPSISSFTPTSGPAGTQVTITGNNFANATLVNFNGIAATFTVSSNTQIRANVPAGATTGRVRVTVPGGTITSTNDFTVTFPPSISSFTPISGPVGTQVTLAGNNFTGATQVAFNGVPTTAFTVVSNTQIRANVPAGATTGRVYVTAPGGTTISTSDFTVIFPPSIGSFTPTSGPVGTQVTITGNNFANATLVNFNGVVAIFTVNSNTQILANIPTGATTGRINVTTPNGTIATTSDFIVTVPPSISSFTPPSGMVGTQVTIIGSNFIGATQVTFNGVAATTFTVVSNTQIRATVSAGATTGRINVTTPNGTTTTASDFIVTIPPSISSFTPASGPVGTQVTITGSNFTGATQVTFNGVVATTFTTISDTQIRANVPTGATTGKIIVITPSGTAVTIGDFTVTIPPNISSFAPTSGPVGTPITITGSNFTGATQVAFNGVVVTTFTVNSNTQIRANVPTGAATGKISVTTPSGTTTTTTDFTVTVPPSISSFAPASGPVGTPVTITGSNFTGATQVAFNGVAVTTFTVNSNTQIRANVPTGAATGKISVTTPSGTTTTTTDFTVTVPPSISSFAPASGPVGTPITITGSDFTGTTQVIFNGVAATTFTVDSDTQIRTNVPTGTTTGKISITTPSGTTTTTTDFTVTVPPSISSFAPASGPVGALITITGSNFTGATQVAFNGVAATTFTVDSDTQIRANVPTGATTGKISITTSSGTTTTTTDFTVTVPPSISSFAPVSGPVGTSITITGSNFTGATQVAFNGVAATAFTVDSDTQIRANVPIGATTGKINITTPSGTAMTTSDFTVTAATAVNRIPNKTVPAEVVLEQNYPNPFNPSTTISYSIPKGMQVTVKIYNIAAQEVAVLVDGYYDSDNYSVVFDASSLPSGIYFTALKAGVETRLRRILFIK